MNVFSLPSLHCYSLKKKAIAVVCGVPTLLLPSVSRGSEWSVGWAIFLLFYRWNMCKWMCWKCYSRIVSCNFIFNLSLFPDYMRQSGFFWSIWIPSDDTVKLFSEYANKNCPDFQEPSDQVLLPVSFSSKSMCMREKML